MSIFATYLALDDDEHEPDCAHWRKVRKGERPFQATIMDGGVFVASGKPCTCGNGAPLVYAGSHVNPSEDDPRGGYLLACGIPDFCHPLYREDEIERPVNYLRLSVGEDPTTYHGMEPGHATVILTRRQVEDLAGTLTSWLERHPDEVTP